MVTLKLSTLLLAYVMVMNQKCTLHAAPPRSSLESDQISLMNYEAQRLINAIAKEFVQFNSDEREQQAAKGNSVTAEKRGCNTATCVTHRLADFLSRSGGLGGSSFLPTDVGAMAFGRRKRHSPL